MFKEELIRNNNNKIFYTKEVGFYLLYAYLPEI